MVSNSNPQEVLNKWTGQHITEEREIQILSLHKYLAKLFTKRPIKVLPYGSLYSESPIILLSTELVQTPTVLLHLECKSLSPK